MAKARTEFYCTDCFAVTPKWAGQCGGCGAWHTIQERERAAVAKGAVVANVPPRPAVRHDTPHPTPLRTSSGERPRFSTGIAEFDFLLGGGIVPGAIILLGGEPGIGKSTILTQVAGNLEAAGRRPLYVAGEESASQLRLRARRIGGAAEDVAVLEEREITAVFGRALEFKPDVIIIDSMQTLYAADVPGSSGSLRQIKECGSRIQEFAKGHDIAVIVIGHVTKDGRVAGPKVLEHVVDAVIQFEHTGDGEHRLMRVNKNRFGSSDEVGVFRMAADGLVPVPNPSAVFLADRIEGSSGSAVTAVVEGSRPLLVEVQALATVAAYGAPARVTTGFNRQRLAILVAVLEKRARLPFASLDAFINIVGGIDLRDPAADAALAAALASSVYDVALPANTLFLGEVGLSGEIRRCPQVERRLAEAARMGFTEVYLSARAIPRETPPGLRLRPVATVSDLVREALQQEPGQPRPGETRARAEQVQRVRQDADPRRPRREERGTTRRRALSMPGADE